MSEPFVGEIQLVGFTFNHRGFANCDGQLLPISQHQALFSLLGTTYGGDGRTTFALPDLRGRAAIHAGTGAGLPTFREGNKGGEVAVSLNAGEMPAHSHTNPDATEGTGHTRTAVATPTTNNPAGNTLSTAVAFDPSAPVIEMSPGSVAIDDIAHPGTNVAGASTPHNNMQPHLTLRYVIALTGVYPSRN